MNRAAAVVLAAAFAAGGCLQPLSHGDNPLFVAWFTQAPEWGYDKVDTMFFVEIQNVQPIKPGQVVGEGGSHQVCLFVDGNVNRFLEDGKPNCQLVGLTNQERISTTWTLRGLSPGTYQVTVLNATTTIEIRPTPEFGEWVRDEWVDLRVTSGGTTGEEWTTGDRHGVVWKWTVEARFLRPSEADVIGFAFIGGGIAAQVRYNGTDTTNATFHGAEFPPEDTVGTISARHAGHGSFSYYDPAAVGGKQTPFVWCCAA